MKRKKLRRSIISVMLVLVMLFTMIPFSQITASAAGGIKGLVVGKVIGIGKAYIYSWAAGSLEEGHKGFDKLLQILFVEPGARNLMKLESLCNQILKDLDVLENDVIRVSESIMESLHEILIDIQEDEIEKQQKEINKITAGYLYTIKQMEMLTNRASEYQEKERIYQENPTSENKRASEVAWQKVVIELKNLRIYLNEQKGSGVGISDNFNKDLGNIFSYTCKNIPGDEYGELIKNTFEVETLLHRTYDLTLGKGLLDHDRYDILSQSFDSTMYSLSLIPYVYDMYLQVELAFAEFDGNPYTDAEEKKMKKELEATRTRATNGMLDVANEFEELTDNMVRSFDTKAYDVEMDYASIKEHNFKYYEGDGKYETTHKSELRSKSTRKYMSYKRFSVDGESFLVPNKYSYSFSNVVGFEKTDRKGDGDDNFAVPQQDFFNFLSTKDGAYVMPESVEKLAPVINQYNETSYNNIGEFINASFGDLESSGQWDYILTNQVKYLASKSSFTKYFDLEMDMIEGDVTDDELKSGKAQKKISISSENMSKGRFDYNKTVMPILCESDNGKPKSTLLVRKSGGVDSGTEISVGTVTDDYTEFNPIDNNSKQEAGTWLSVKMKVGEGDVFEGLTLQNDEGEVLYSIMDSDSYYSLKDEDGYVYVDFCMPYQYTKVVANVSEKEKHQATAEYDEFAAAVEFCNIIGTPIEDADKYHQGDKIYFSLGIDDEYEFYEVSLYNETGEFQQVLVTPEQYEADKNIYGLALYSIADLPDENITIKVETALIDEQDGSEEYPYIIKTASQFNYYSDLVLASEDYAKAHYLLKADVDFNGKELHPFAHKNGFSGNIDGNGHIIHNYYVDNNKNKFAIVEHLTKDGTIENLHLKGLLMPKDSELIDVPKAAAFTLVNDGTITSCSVMDDECLIVATGEGVAGGISAQNNGVIKNCSTGTSMIGYYLGGIVGINNGKILNSYSKSVINGTLSEKANFSSIGGIVGENRGYIENVYFDGAPATDEVEFAAITAENKKGILVNAYSSLKNSIYFDGSMYISHDEMIKDNFKDQLNYGIGKNDWKTWTRSDEKNGGTPTFISDDMAYSLHTKVANNAGKITVSMASGALLPESIPAGTSLNVEIRPNKNWLVNRVSVLDTNLSAVNGDVLLQKFEELLVDELDFKETEEGVYTTIFIMPEQDTTLYGSFIKEENSAKDDTENQNNENTLKSNGKDVNTGQNLSVIFVMIILLISSALILFLALTKAKKNDKRI